MRKLLTLLALGLLFPTIAFAAGIGISEEAVSVSFESGAEYSKQLSIHNTSQAPAIYQVYPDAYENLILIDATEFRLEAGEGRVIQLSFESFPPGQYQTDLSLVASDIDALPGTPKTGVKLPVSIESLEPVTESRFFSMRYAIPVGMLTLGFIFFLYSLRGKKQDPHQPIKKTSNSRLFLFLSIIAFLIAGILLYLSFKPIDENQSNSVIPETTTSREYVVSFEFPTDTTEYAIELSGAQTAFSVIDELAKQGRIQLDYDPPNEMGVFVKEINGVKNGLDNQYWVYEINGKRIPVAADKTVLGENDGLVWKFVEPSQE